MYEKYLNYDNYYFMIFDLNYQIIYYYERKPFLYICIHIIVQILSKCND